MSRDHNRRTNVGRSGDPGHSPLLHNVAPVMRRKGMTREQIDTIMAQNPTRLLTFV